MKLLDEMWAPTIAAMRAGRAYPQTNRRTAERLVTALDTLLTTRDTIESEHSRGSV